MSEIDRPDWEPAEAPEPSPQRPQTIPRPDWTETESTPPSTEIHRADWDGSEPEAKAERSDDGRIIRPDWIEEDEEPEPHSPEPQIEIDQPQILKALSNSTEHDLGVAGEAVTGILDNMPDREDFEAGFDGLPTETQNAIVGELAFTDRENAPHANVEDVNLFATTPEGAELVSEWGIDADINLGILQARLSRMEANTDMGKAFDWFDSLSSEQAKTVIQVLAQ